MRGADSESGIGKNNNGPNRDESSSSDNLVVFVRIMIHLIHITNHSYSAPQPSTCTVVQQCRRVGNYYRYQGHQAHHECDKVRLAVAPVIFVSDKCSIPTRVHS